MEETYKSLSAVDAQRLWEKYEDIAMHFNDLLMRLRTQSLAGIAAIATIVSLFTRTDAIDARIDWLVATCSFFALAVFWIAIACVDLIYYNRLLLGAVAALMDLETRLASKEDVLISMSTKIEAVFSEGWFGTWKRVTGVAIFYALVFLVIVAGTIFSFCMYLQTSPDDQMLKLWRVPV